jgi:hypothetical protein
MDNVCESCRSMKSRRVQLTLVCARPREVDLTDWVDVFSNIKSFHPVTGDSFASADHPVCRVLCFPSYNNRIRSVQKLHPSNHFTRSTRETFALSISLHRRQTAPRNTKEQSHQKSVLFLPYRLKSARNTKITSLAALQQHNSKSQPCPAENQTFQPSQMAMRNHQHPLAVKCVRDQV